MGDLCDHAEDITPEKRNIVSGHDERYPEVGDEEVLDQNAGGNCGDGLGGVVEGNGEYEGGGEGRESEEEVEVAEEGEEFGGMGGVEETGPMLDEHCDYDREHEEVSAVEGFGGSSWWD